jgi:hypothetical protein
MSFLDRYSFWREDGLSIMQSIRLAREMTSLLYYEFYYFNKPENRGLAK